MVDLDTRHCLWFLYVTNPNQLNQKFLSDVKVHILIEIGPRPSVIDEQTGIRL